MPRKSRAQKRAECSNAFGDFIKTVTKLVEVFEARSVLLSNVRTLAHECDDHHDGQACKRRVKISKQVQTGGLSEAQMKKFIGKVNKTRDGVIDACFFAPRKPRAKKKAKKEE